MVLLRIVYTHWIAFFGIEIFYNFAYMKTKRKSGGGKILLLAVTGIVMLGIAMYFIARKPERLPVYNPADIHPDLVDESLRDVDSGHRVLPFRVVDQNGDTITGKDYEGKIYVANFFFTRCKTICPPMMYHMGIIQDAVRDDPEVMLLSFSVTPVIDSVPVLKAYAEQRHIDSWKWHITTGDKKHIYRLARRSYFAVLDHGDGDLQDFIHTEKFILVDKNRQIRGFYDGTDPGTPDQVLHDIALLKEED